MTRATSDGAAAPAGFEELGSNPAPRATIAEIVDRRLSRRAAMRGLVDEGSLLPLRTGFGAGWASAGSSGTSSPPAPSSSRRVTTSPSSA